jgi:predicted acyl esterase
MNSSSDKKLYIVHVGFYEEEPNYGVYESHTNIYVAADTPQEAKAIVKALPVYAKKRMHTDGIHEISAVQGYRIRLDHDKSLDDQSVLKSFGYEALNPNAPLSSF